MKTLCYTRVFVVLLVMSLSLTVPAEDLPETAYDESEALPYESTALISDVMPQAAASATQAERVVPRRQPDALFWPPLRRTNGTVIHRHTEARVALSLICTLLC